MLKLLSASVVNLLFLLAAVALCAVLFMLLIKRYYWGILIYICIFLLYTVLESPPRVDIGAISIYPLDLVTVTYLVLPLTQILRKGSVSRETLSVIVLLLLVLIGFGNGISKYGLEAAGNQVRSYLYFIAPMLYMVSYPNVSRTVRVLPKMWVYSAAFLVCVVLYRLTLAFGFGLAKPNWLSAGGFPFRVIPASGSFYIFQAALIILVLGRMEAFRIPFRTVLLVLFLSCVIFLQHRTVWVIALLLIFWFIVSQAKTRGFVLAIVLMVFASVVAFALMAPGSAFATSLFASASNLQTLDWRLAGWIDLLDQFVHGSWIEIIFGHPFGYGYQRMVGELAVAVSPHNFYIQVLWDLGLVGLSIVLVIYLRTLARLRGQRYKSAYKQISYYVILSHLVYFFTYSLSFEQALLAGLALSVASLKPTAVPDQKKQVDATRITSLGVTIRGGSTKGTLL